MGEMSLAADVLVISWVGIRYLHIDTIRRKIHVHFGECEITREWMLGSCKAFRRKCS